MSSKKKEQLTEPEIEEGLQTLGFTKNDSKVLLTLAKYKIFSPADIAKHSSVDRARVYDSLNRLMEKGYIQKEPVKRGANYQVIPIRRIFKSIRKGYRELIDKTLQLEDSINNLKVEEEESEARVWAVGTSDKIRQKIKDLIEDAEKRIYFVITPDLIMEEFGGFEWIMKELWNKKFTNSDIDIKIAIKFNIGQKEELKEEVIKLLKINVAVHSIEGANVIPFGLLIVDNGFLLTTLDQVREAPEYTSGIWLENGKSKQIQGYVHLFNHFLSSECKEAELTTVKRKKDSPEIYNN